jgi:hypothetical protein
VVKFQFELEDALAEELMTILRNAQTEAILQMMEHSTPGYERYVEAYAKYRDDISKMADTIAKGSSR